MVTTKMTTTMTRKKKMTTKKKKTKVKKGFEEEKHVEKKKTEKQHKNHSPFPLPFLHKGMLKETKKKCKEEEKDVKKRQSQRTNTLFTQPAFPNSMLPALSYSPPCSPRFTPHFYLGIGRLPNFIKWYMLKNGSNS
eukprot:TRINITY_DN10746_c0_g1_i2.p2 TRINITY_DN10746_c0_g1~~TRINITY_DN10746_c0_g1_i2.p2  ORF type:complete len:143 (-),score=33.37 TRINITY_DN10746_c0_g1_i2:464-871(-)